MMPVLRSAIIAMVLSIMPILFYAPRAESFSMTVNTTADGEDFNPGDFICDIDPGPGTLCSLRAAITEANQWPNSHEVIELPPGIYQLTMGELVITDGLDIESSYPGYTETTIIDGGDSSRIFDLRGSAVTNITVRFYNFTIQNGQAAGGTGGGGGINATFVDLVLESIVIRHNDVLGTGTSDTGGGLGVSDTGSNVYIRRTTFANNSAHRGGGIFISNGTHTEISDTMVSDNYAVSVGGGINTYGDATIKDSTITGNVANTTGGIAIYDKAILTNVTISGNRASGTGLYYGTQGTGGGLSISYSAPAEQDMPYLRNCTLFENIGGNSFYMGTNTSIKMHNTLISAVTGDACNISVSATYFTESNNLSGDNTCSFSAESDLVNTNPMLMPLADNGGKTLTHLPQKGSPVINAGYNFLIPELLKDQRGISRPQDNIFDIGAVEVEKQCNFYPIRNSLGKTSFICL